MSCWYLHCFLLGPTAPGDNASAAWDAFKKTIHDAHKHSQDSEQEGIRFFQIPEALVKDLLLKQPANTQMQTLVAEFVDLSKNLIDEDLLVEAVNKYVSNLEQKAVLLEKIKSANDEDEDNDEAEADGE